MNAADTIQKLKRFGLHFDPGLNDEEIERAEREYEILFPPDLKELLQTGVPSGEKFPHWRDFSERNVKRIRKQLDWPLQGLLFDVEMNRYWHQDWGDRPSDMEEAKAAATRFYQEVPKLIPVYGHRYLPSAPHEPGNPVFSVWQADVIPYGENLQQYWEIEFGKRPYSDIKFEKLKPIPFWSEWSE
ncbi:hypothetical protein B9G55_06380 [Saccharibacillus sp. O16]|nr:hypothetical protein B9G55_06380 [Saccharibacillus sp. O16]